MIQKPTDPTQVLIASLNDLAAQEAAFQKALPRTRLAREQQIALWKDHFERSLPVKGQSMFQRATIMYALLELSLEWLIEMSSARLLCWVPRDVYDVVGIETDHAIARVELHRIPPDERPHSDQDSEQRLLRPEEHKAELFKMVATLTPDELVHFDRFISTFTQSHQVPPTT